MVTLFTSYICTITIYRYKSRELHNMNYLDSIYMNEKQMSNVTKVK